jgi:leader peptidase (prepilin peptidase)/N-methyltransferase
MAAVRAVAFGLFGLAVGSFLTVVTHRVPRRQSVVAPRSACPACGEPIRPRDNVPVVSYLLLGGRCRHCGARISPRYPLTELATAVLFVGAALRFEELYVAAVLALFFAVLLAVAVIDAEHRIVPNRIVYPSLAGFGALVLVGALLTGEMRLLPAVLGLLAFGGGLFLVALVSRGMGMGDVKLAALIGLVLGSLGLRYVWVGAAAAILLGGLGAIAAVVFLRMGRKQAIPFGPYLAAGAVLAAFVAPRVAAWYAGLAR